MTSRVATRWRSASEFKSAVRSTVDDMIACGATGFDEFLRRIDPDVLVGPGVVTPDGAFWRDLWITLEPVVAEGLARRAAERWAQPRWLIRRSRAGQAQAAITELARAYYDD